MKTILLMLILTFNGQIPENKKPEKVQTKTEVRDSIVQSLIRLANKARKAGLFEEESVLRSIAGDWIKPQPCDTDTDCEQRFKNLEKEGN